MITLEQIKLLENKITRAIELIRVLKEENSTLRKGLESAQKRMKELESLVDGFKTDQREIESVIVRALQHLDELEEAASAARKPDSNGKRPSSAAEEPPRPARPRLVRPPVRPRLVRPRLVILWPVLLQRGRQRKSWTSSNDQQGDGTPDPGGSVYRIRGYPFGKCAVPYFA